MLFILSAGSWLVCFVNCDGVKGCAQDHRLSNKTHIIALQLRELVLSSKHTIGIIFISGCVSVDVFVMLVRESEMPEK